MDEKEKLKRFSRQLERILAELKKSVVFVEGIKDKQALGKFGICEVLTISGNLRLSCMAASEKGVKKVVILTDNDERGDELAREAEQELTRYGIKFDAETRKTLGTILDMRNIENLENKYRKFLEKIM